MPTATGENGPQDWPVVLVSRDAQRSACNRGPGMTHRAWQSPDAGATVAVAPPAVDAARHAPWEEWLLRSSSVPANSARAPVAAATHFLATTSDGLTHQGFFTAVLGGQLSGLRSFRPQPLDPPADDLSPAQRD